MEKRLCTHGETSSEPEPPACSPGASSEERPPPPKSVRPTIQSDHGSGFIARDFAETLAESGVGHTLIRPHTPTDNAEIERNHRTIGEKMDEHDLEDVTQAKARHRGHHRHLQSPPAAFVVVVPAAGGLLSRRSGGVTGRTPPEVTRGQRTAKAGESQTQAAADPLGGGPNRLLSKTPRCLTLSQINHPTLTNPSAFP
jgi:hypothetical protein